MSHQFQIDLDPARPMGPLYQLPRYYQRAATVAVHRARMEGCLRPAVVLPTGTGKTRVMSDLPVLGYERFLCTANSIEVANQIAGSFMRNAPHLRTGIEQGEKITSDSCDVTVATIQSISRKASKERLNRLLARRPEVVVIDEYHHSAAESYLHLLREVGIGEPGAPLLVGFTATPYRADKQNLGKIWERIVYRRHLYEPPSGGMIAEGWLCDYRVYRVKTSTDLSAVPTGRGGDYVEDKLAERINTDDRNDRICSALKQHAMDRKSVLIFAANVAHAKSIVLAMRDPKFGFDVEMVTAKTEETVRKRILSDFDAGRLWALVNVGIVTEGVDFPRIDCLVLGRPTKSPVLACLDLRTEVLTREGWRFWNEVEIGDEIAAYDMPTRRIDWQRATGKVVRGIELGECFYELATGTVDIRVTNNHRMVWQSRKQGDWRVSEAQELAAVGDTWRLPVAGFEDVADLPLSDAEVSFIGWVQTDGCYSKNRSAITISQQSPENCAEIERMLEACGFKYGKSTFAGPTNFGERTHPLNVYRLSRGQPRKTGKHLRGWGALADWIPKVTPDAWLRLRDMSERQLQIFLYAMNLANGQKGKTNGWVRRGYEICSPDKRMLDWVQSICVRRGWRANVQWRENSTQAIWFIMCKREPHRMVGGAGSKDRGSFTRTSAQPGERVWCLEVPHGAFVVRRNGKAFVVGNCQMRGRGLRPFEGKSDLLVLNIVDLNVDQGADPVGSDLGVALDLEGRSFKEAAAVLERVKQAGLPADDVETLSQLEARERAMLGLSQGVREIKTVLEAVELFGNGRPLDAVLGYSKYSWTRLHDAHYTIGTPDNRLNLRRDEVGCWHLQDRGNLHAIVGHGDRPDFASADSVAKKVMGQKYAKLKEVDSLWRFREPSPALLAKAKQLGAAALPPWCKSAGHVSDLVSLLEAQREVQR